MPSYLIDTPIPKTLSSAAPESSLPALIPEEHQDPSVALDEMDDEEQELQDLLFGKADLKSLTKKDIQHQVAKVHLIQSQIVEIPGLKFQMHCTVNSNCPGSR